MARLGVARVWIYKYILRWRCKYRAIKRYMTFKTQPNRYSIGLAPTGRACCRGCKRPVERGALRLATHAFVRPNRGTTFVRHLTPGCMGAVLAADVMRARGIARGVCVNDGVAPEVISLVWDALEGLSAKANGEEAGRSRQRGHRDDKVGATNQPVISAVFGHLPRIKVVSAEQKEDTVGQESWEGAVDT